MKPQVLVFLSDRVWDLAQFYIGYINHIRFGEFFFLSKHVQPVGSICTGRARRVIAYLESLENFKSDADAEQTAVAPQSKWRGSKAASSSTEVKSVSSKQTWSKPPSPQKKTTLNTPNKPRMKQK
jgi:hypothetical protein